MTLCVQQSALMMTVQDGGRHGYQRFGMPESGPMDWWAFRAGNVLVGNPPSAACVEIGFSDAEFYLEGRCLLAVGGSGYRLFVNQREMPLWMAFLGKKGDRIRLEKIPGGSWVYLAAAGGIQSPEWMGSRSAYPTAGLGTLLSVGDRLPLMPLAVGGAVVAGRSIPEAARPAYAEEPHLRVIPGPHQARFAQSSWETFLSDAYQVSINSNRMGYRLAGPQLAHQGGPDVVSQGMVLGAIQVPGDGQPIVMMPDHPTTGGYTCIATVARVDLPLLAQVEPGRGQVRFTPIDVSAAQSAYNKIVERLDSGDDFQEDVWIGL